MEDYRHPLLQKRNQLDFQQAAGPMEQDGVDALIVLNRWYIYYATGDVQGRRHARLMPGWPLWP